MKVNTELDAGEWTLDTAATSIGFQAKAIFGMKVRGRFDRYESTITVGASAAESAISTIVWTDSVDTGIKMRDEPLRADNVFATTRFPTLEFRSTAIVETPTGLDVTGTLRVRDISQPVSFHAARSPALHRRGGGVAHRIRDHPTGHRQARHGPPRRRAKAGLTVPFPCRV